MRNLLLILLVLLAAGGLAAQIDRGPQIRVLSQTDCCPSVLTVAVGPDAAARVFDLEWRVDEVTGIVGVSGGKVLLLGRLPSRGDTLLPFDPLSGTAEAALWAYGFAVSPSGRYVVYNSHYPPQVAPEVRRSVVLLYDFTGSPEENRKGSALRRWPEPNGGRPLFPSANACSGSHDVFAGEPFILVSPFLWSSDETRLVFFVSLNDHAEHALVRIDLEKGACTGTVLVPLDLAALNQESWREPPFRFAASELRWVGDAEDRVTAVMPPGSQYGKSVTLPVP